MCVIGKSVIAVILIFTIGSCAKKKITLEEINTLARDVSVCSETSQCTLSDQECSCMPLAHNAQSDIGPLLDLKREYRTQNGEICPQCVASSYTAECRSGYCEAVLATSAQNASSRSSGHSKK